MLPSNFDFAMFPAGTKSSTLKEIGMLASTIETIDYAITSWVKEDLKLSARTNEGFTRVPVLWQTPERAYQIKNEKSLRDEGGALKLPLISIERTGITKDPMRKGGWQAQLYSTDGDGRTGRMVIAKKIKQDKTREFAVVGNRRVYGAEGENAQRWVPAINKKVIIQTLSIPIPIYINIDYKITIKSEYQEQMNQLVTPFIGRTGQINSFVMKNNGHLYEAFIDQTFAHNNNVANLDEDMRMFSTDINIRVLGYLIGDGDNDDRPIIRYRENTVQLTYPRESTINPAGYGTNSTGENDSIFGTLVGDDAEDTNASGQIVMKENTTVLDWDPDTEGRQTEEEASSFANSAISEDNPIWDSDWFYPEDDSSGNGGDDCGG
jgi:hypothetical protein